MPDIRVILTMLFFVGWIVSSSSVIMAILRKRRLYAHADEKMKVQLDKFSVTRSIIVIIIVPLVCFLLLMLS
jgi:hypothetical protein